MAKPAKNSVQFDELDQKLLEELQKNCNQNFKELTKKLKVPHTTIRRRVGQLEQKGLITGYKAILDKEKLGEPTTAFVFLKAKQYPRSQGEFSIHPLAEKIAKLDRVKECHIMLGGYDLLIKIYGENERDVGNWMTKTLVKIPELERTQTHLSMRKVKETLDFDFVREEVSRI